jgi:HD-like signal output (HDOD) protein
MCDTFLARMSIADAEILQAAKALGVIGGGNQTAYRILATLCDPALDARQIAEVIQRDPGIAARVLKVANSAFYGSSRQIGSLDRALMLLGLDGVRTIAAAACLDRGTPRDSHQAPIDPRALTRHCVASAFAAESLSKRSGRAVPSVAFMAALLHDFWRRCCTTSAYPCRSGSIPRASCSCCRPWPRTLGARRRSWKRAS